MRPLSAFTLHRPGTLAETTALLARHPGARLVAGGTDLVPNLRHGLEEPALLVDLGAVHELQGITLAGDGGLVLGAGTTLAQLAADAGIAQALPALAEAARAVAATAHRSAATLGGNLCQDTRCLFYNQGAWWRASNGWCLKRGGTRCHVAPQGARCHAAFCSDLAPVLLCVDAEVELHGGGGTRRIPLRQLYRDDGAAHLALAPGEVLARVHVAPRAAGTHVAFAKLRSRGGIDFPLASVALAARIEDGRIAALQVAVSGTNCFALLLQGTDALHGATPAAAAPQLATLVQRQVTPMRTGATPGPVRREAASALAQGLLRDCGD